MSKNENMKKLKMALTERKPLHVYFKRWDECFDMGIFYFDLEQGIYQGEWGMMTLEGVYKFLNDDNSFIALEVCEDESR